MVVNFKVRKISRGTRKLVRILTLKKIKKKRDNANENTGMSTQGCRVRTSQEFVAVKSPFRT
jgi:hypothetical protein